ncbi:GNAT family N-acetyltransferase [Subtercola sp. YIM 133946]|uniref:GNAT family N-acetyltransferase n=1 Tax=Subtercola sp. YIM 133946 TaxID=3118909 RepID=UPI002F95EAFA
MQTTTPRLLLRPYSLAEAERVLARTPAAHDVWAPDYPFADEIDILPRFIADFRANGDPQPFGPYVVCRRSDNAAIGGIGFTGSPDDEGAVEVGYGLVASARGNGFAAEALAAAVGIARASGARLLRADTTLDNVASQRVLAGAGLVEVRREGQALYFELSL